MKNENGKDVLIVADEFEQMPFYSEVLERLGYNPVSIFDEWNENVDLQSDEHCGPLYRKFVDSLLKKNPEKYSAVFVDWHARDLIMPMISNGYGGRIVIPLCFNDQRTEYYYTVSSGLKWEKRIGNVLGGINVYDRIITTPLSQIGVMGALSVSCDILELN